MIPGSANPLLLKSAAAAGGYQIERSLRFNSSDSASLSRASYAGSGTFSCWVKRCKLGTAQTIISGVAFNSSDQLNSSTAVFRDPSALMHVLVSTSGTYVNNTLVASGSAITPGIIGSGCDLYLADVHFIDGQALTPSSFTEVSATTGQLIPKAYTGSFGTNGFWLKFSDNSNNTATTLGKDYSGNSNNWTPNNLSVTAGAGNDSLVDTPTSYGTDTGAGGQVRGNYCTLNPLDSGGGTVSNGNLEHTFSSSNTRIRSTISIPETGKWYAEFVASNTGGGNSLVGVSIGTNALTGTNWYLGNDAGSWGCQIGSGTMYTYNAGGFSSFGTAASGDVIAVAVDRAAGKIWWAVNNTWIGSGDPANGTNARYTNIPSTGTLFFAISNASNSSIVCNFGQRAFAYTAPSGFKALCDTNLPAPVVAKPNTVFDVKLYTGNSSTQTISGLGFSPDLVWLKARSFAPSHHLFDTIRGATKFLGSDTTNAEQTGSDRLTAFDSAGFTLGSNAEVNQNGSTYVAWAWDAGSSTASNPDGSITSQVRANASAGFSVATWTGSGSGSITVGHGLGVAPQFFIVKDRSNARNWLVYHIGMGATRGMQLNLTTGQSGADAGYWNNTAPTSTVATIGTYGNEAANYVGYFWTPVVGYSSFGTWQNNGSTDGTFVYLGFRPRTIILKNSDNTENWYIYDSARHAYNVAPADSVKLQPNTSNAEGNGGGFAPSATIDFLSNGFKIRTTNTASGEISFGTRNYIYGAWAESPFQYARAR